MTKLDKIRELLDISSKPEDAAEEFCQLTDDEQAKFCDGRGRLIVHPVEVRYLPGWHG